MIRSTNFRMFVCGYFVLACAGKADPQAEVSAHGGARSSAGGQSGSANVGTGGTATSGGSNGGATVAPAGGSGVSAGGTITSVAGAGGRSETNGGVSGASGGAVSASGGAASANGGAVTGGAASKGGAANAMGGASGAASGGSASADVVATIHNGVFWSDTAGNRIEAHGGGFLLKDGVWYWVGEDKSHNAAQFKAVNLYASRDLGHWEFKKTIITKSTHSTLNVADRIIERPKLAYNEKTQKYVMWLHWEGKNYAEAAAGVFSSNSVDGDYTFVRSFRPNNNMSRDDNLFVDDDGKAYFVSAANENADLIIYELTDDYLDIKRQLVTLWAGSYREAPAVMKHEGRYYLVTSGATGWDPNQAKYATATSMAGPWSALSNLGNNTTFDSQSTYLIPIRGSNKTTFVFAGDRWQDPDLKSSKYIWLPLRMNGTALSLDWVPDWQLNLTKGTWSALDDFIPQGEWTLVHTDSQETSGEDGRAVNAFDDSPSSIWHTVYDGANTPKHPHEIQIDLGATYALTAFRYLPRQDKDDHGMVKDYDFYASEDKANWGSPLATGSFNTDRAAKRVNFTQKLARYVRFVAKSEINGEAWASIAELDLVGTRR